MAKTLTSNISTEIATTEHRPIEIYDVYLDDSTLYLTSNDDDISFYDIDGVARTYTAVAIGRSDVSTNIDNKIDSVKVTLDNINRGMSSYIASYEFRGRRMIVRRVYEEFLATSTDYITIFDGLMDNPIISETSMEVTAKSRMGTLNKIVPRRMFQLHCNWEFGSTECGFDKTLTQAVGKTVHTTSSTARLDVIDGSLNALADDYYKNGVIEVTAGDNDNDKRMITYSSGLGTSGIKIGLDYALNSDPAGDTITIQQGCDKTYTTCNTTHSNRDNYGGFLNIPELLVIR